MRALAQIGSTTAVNGRFCPLPFAGRVLHLAAFWQTRQVDNTALRAATRGTMERRKPHESDGQSIIPPLARRQGAIAIRTDRLFIVFAKHIVTS